MKIKTNWLVLLVALFAAVSVFAESRTKEELAQRAVSNDAAVSAEAIKELRALGRDGLETLFQTYAGEIEKFAANGEASDDWKRVAAALDAVAMQKDAYAARLFWFTDLDEAKREAKRTNKPVLSLRLLGNLNEEFSCANSRFFRALLYSNTEIAAYLRANYVLHWKSVRPAPRVTIDFGDGHRIERTVTGNSIHYVLNEKGDIIDALPGLYAPADFLNFLLDSREFYKATEKLQPWEVSVATQRYRRERFDRLAARRDRLIKLAKVELKEPAPTPNEKPTAISVAPLAVTKMMTERSVLSAINDGFARYAPQIALDDWRKLAKLYAGDVRFDDATLRFIKRQHKQTGLTDAEFAALLKNLKEFVALDTTRNEFLLHPKLYEWLNTPGARPLDPEGFNSLVYAELFKTPGTDKWLGLYESDVYTALDGGGIIK